MPHTERRTGVNVALSARSKRATGRSYYVVEHRYWFGATSPDALDKHDASMVRTMGRLGAFKDSEEHDADTGQQIDYWQVPMPLRLDGEPVSLDGATTYLDRQLKRGRVTWRYGAYTHGCNGTQQGIVGMGVGSGAPLPKRAKPQALRNGRYKALDKAGIVCQWEIAALVFGDALWRDDTPLETQLDELSRELRGEPIGTDWRKDAAFWLDQLQQWSGFVPSVLRAIDRCKDIAARTLLDYPGRADVEAEYTLWHEREQAALRWLATNGLIEAATTGIRAAARGK